MSDTTGHRRLLRRDFVKMAAGAAGATAMGTFGALLGPVSRGKAASRGRVEVVWWRSLGGRNGEALDELVERFNASQDRVTVKVVYHGGYAATRDKFTAAVAAGGNALPDLVMLSDVIFVPFARYQRLEPLDELIEGPNGIDLKDYYGVVERGRVNGAMYQLPLAVSTPVLYYNADALEAAGLTQPPQTWDEFFEVHVPRATRKEGSRTSVYGFVFLANVDWWWQQSYVWTHGGDLSDDRWNVYFDSPQVIEFLTRFQRLFQAGYAYLPTQADGGTLAYFGSGKGALMIESSGVLGRIDEVVAGRFKTGLAYLPAGPAGRVVPTGGAGISIVAGIPQERKLAAWEFIRWLQQPEQVAYFCQISGYLPYTRSAERAMATFIAEDPRRKVAIEQLAWSRGQSPIQTVPRAVDIYFDAMLRVMQTNTDPAALMRDVQRRIEAILVEEGLR